MAAAGAAYGSPYATEIISYYDGNGAVAGYTDPNGALGSPSSRTPDWPTGEVDVTVFNAPWGTDQVLSLGRGGSLVVKFDQPVWENTDANVWGMDLLVFGNSFYNDTSWPNGAVDASASIYGQPGRIAVSQDGNAWYEVAGYYSDDRFPTMGFRDTSGPYGDDGNVLSDFTIPVDPNFSAVGKTFAQIQSGYGGSGGGAGIDFHATGLAWIQYVKVFLNADDVTEHTEVDAFADVAPEPATMGLIAAGAAVLIGRRRHRS